MGSNAQKTLFFGAPKVVLLSVPPSAFYFTFIMVKVKIKLKEGCEDLGIPRQLTPGSAAVDLRAAIDKVITLNQNEPELVPTGLFMEIPQGYTMHITPRSGLALKHAISIVNSPGIVDSDYRGEIGIILINHSDEPFAIRRGDRIAQGSFVKIENSEFELVTELSETERGAGGYGHTGKE